MENKSFIIKYMNIEYKVVILQSINVFKVEYNFDVDDVFYVVGEYLLVFLEIIEIDFVWVR